MAARKLTDEQRKMLAELLDDTEDKGGDNPPAVDTESEHVEVYRVRKSDVPWLFGTKPEPVAEHEPEPQPTPRNKYFGG